jgi:hypothetical protein
MNVTRVMKGSSVECYKVLSDWTACWYAFSVLSVLTVLDSVTQYPCVSL